MKYSLLSRFQGCLEGMAIADQFGLWVTQAVQTAVVPAAKDKSGKKSPGSVNQFSRLKVYHWHPGLSYSSNQAASCSLWVELAIQVSEALIQANDWSFQAMSLDTASLLASRGNSGALAIATLPISLFFHDDPVLQQQHLRQTVRSWGGTSEMEDWVAVFGYAIAQALKEQLVPQHFLAQLLSDLSRTDPDLPQRSPEVLKVLALLDGIISQGTASWSASTKIEQLVPQEAISIVLALYCFLCTPDHWHLSVTHATRLAPTCPVVCTLTAGLSGAYNSHSSLPLTWKVALLQSAVSMSSYPSFPVTCAELAPRLFASWSGMFDTFPRLTTGMIPVTSPRI